MRETKKYILLYTGALFLLVFMAIGLASAQENNDIVSVEAVEGEFIESQRAEVGDEDQDESEFIELNQAELDQMLAPIALYPDSLLSQILVAATYPLEIIQATRWRQDNSHLDEDEALQAVEDKDWDPSVKALVPFTDLLEKLSDDLEWLQNLGDAFLANEEQILASIQGLRVRARDAGSLENSEYIEVVEEDDNISIQPVEREIVYVPYYDTRTVYGPWHWHSYQPIYWHRPAHYYWHAGFYWSPRFYVRPSYFIGGFHWHRRHLVVNNYNYNRYGYRDDGYRRVRVTEYQRWQHNPVHRRGVRYNNRGVKSLYLYNKKRPVKAVSSREAYANNTANPVNAYSRTVKTARVSPQRATSPTRVESRLKQEKNRSFDKVGKPNTNRVVGQRQMKQTKRNNYAQTKPRTVVKPDRQTNNYARQQPVTRSTSKPSRNSLSKPRDSYSNKRMTRPSSSGNKSRSTSRYTSSAPSSSRSVNRSSGSSGKSTNSKSKQRTNR